MIQSNPKLNQAIQKHLCSEAKRCFKHLHACNTLPSTHQCLLELPPTDPILQEGGAVLALKQTAGIGRRGAAWEQPGQSLALSLALPTSASVDPTLTLALALAWRDILAQAHPKQSLCLKWPNDIWDEQGKIAGLMVEQPHPGILLMSMGLNLEPPKTMAQASFWQGTCSWAELAALVINAVPSCWEHWQTEGFAPLRHVWLQHDRLLGKNITFETPSGQHTGQALGLTEAGGLQVLEPEGVCVHCQAWSVRENT